MKTNRFQFSSLQNSQTRARINFRWIANLNVKEKSTKPLEENRQEFLWARKGRAGCQSEHRLVEQDWEMEAELRDLKVGLDCG